MGALLVICPFGQAYFANKATESHQLSLSPSLLRPTLFISSRCRYRAYVWRLQLGLGQGSLDLLHRSLYPEKLILVPFGKPSLSPFDPRRNFVLTMKDCCLISQCDCIMMNYQVHPSTYRDLSQHSVSWSHLLYPCL